MDFKALISKLDSMDAPVKTPAAPELPKAVQLNEDAQLRVLAGQTTYVAEAKKKKEEEKVDEAAEKTATTWTDMKGNKHPATKVKGDKYTGKEAEKEEKSDKKAKKESVEPEFKSKFMKMVEAKKEEADKKKADKKKKMEEGAKPDFLDLDKDGDKKEPMKGAAKAKGGDKKEGGKKGMSDAQKKYFGGKNESKTQSKKVVAESVETKLSFREMMKLVVESGGQQQIDPLDQELFAWATRVAKNKLGEGMKAEVYAGMVYERMGGAFQMYDVLSESKKKISEGRTQLDEGIFDKVKSAIMSKILPKLSSDEKSEMADAVKSALGTDQVSMKDLTMDNIKAVAKALGAKPKTADAGMGEDEDSYFDKSATLGEKLANLGGLVGGIGSLVAAFGFSGPGWLIIPGIIGIMFMSQIGMSKKGSY